MLFFALFILHYPTPIIYIIYLSLGISIERYDMRTRNLCYQIRASNAVVLMKFCLIHTYLSVYIYIHIHIPVNNNNEFSSQVSKPKSMHVHVRYTIASTDSSIIGLSATRRDECSLIERKICCTHLLQNIQ